MQPDANMNTDTQQQSNQSKSKSEHDATPAGESNFINEKELLKRLPVSRRTLFSWRTTGKIPFVRLGGRRVLFHWPSIEAALLRMQTGGVQ
ncbi:MAG TPA: helix-turn-helix domain-containing protein [Verrucomicrobiae bacterium]|jgi:predicted DNA-binding transcriptional regulator AlpA|nr:helix-turn-helix domain-containing protein [Verrucomicrobiae bacterium]